MRSLGVTGEPPSANPNPNPAADTVTRAARDRTLLRLRVRVRVRLLARELYGDNKKPQAGLPANVTKVLANQPLPSRCEHAAGGGLLGSSAVVPTRGSS